MLLSNLIAMSIAAFALADNSLFSTFSSELRGVFEERPLAATAALISAGLGSQILNIRKSPKKKSRMLVDAKSRPVVQMHGLGDFANNPRGMVPLANSLSEHLGGAYVLNVQLGTNSQNDLSNSFFMSLNEQVEYFASVVTADPALREGFNAVGFSQGSLIIRGYIERHNNPPVLNFMSLHAPMAGVSDAPDCREYGSLCALFADVVRAAAVDPITQKEFAPSNYFRDPERIEEYNTYNSFLKDINNEISTADEEVARKYRSNWADLSRLCLVKAREDSALVPSDSAWFQFYEDGARNYLLEFTETPWYEGDYFGLRTLHEQGKIAFHSTDGGHLELDVDTILDLVGMCFFA